MEKYTFSELFEMYSTGGVKELVKNITEEATSEEFDKEVEDVKDKNAGKIRNKKIANAAVQAVEIQKEDTLNEYETTKVNIKGKSYYKDDEGNITPVDSKSGQIVKNYIKNKYNKKTPESSKDFLTPEQSKKKLEIMDSMHKNIDKFKEKYGDRAYKVVHDIADKMVRKQISEDYDIDELIERSLTDSEMEDREDAVKGMKKNKNYFKNKYGDRWKEVMYATATKMAKEK